MYVGRIVVVGKAEMPFVAYRVSSRSFPNRAARVTEAGVAIQPLDPEDLKKNPYIAYNCIRVGTRGVVVSNGTHTDGIYDAIESGMSPDAALQSVLTEMGYEKDELNTPRIAGVLAGDVGYLGIVRIDGMEITCFDLQPNSCRLICTYELDKVAAESEVFVAADAQAAARYVIEDGLFKTLEKPVCSAAWMDGLAVYNPHE